jgi:predicted dehydrogenase
MAASTLTPMLAWLDPEQADLVRQVAREAGLTVVGAGSPAKGQAAAVATAMEAAPVDDLRKSLATTEARVVLIALAGDFGRSPEDAAAVASAGSRGVHVISLTPVPPGALDAKGAGWLESGSGPRPIDVIRFIPLTTLAGSIRGGADVIESIGTMRCATIEVRSRASEASLGAGHFAATEYAHRLMGEPESVQATLVPAAGREAAQREDLRVSGGHLLATLRYGDGRSANVLVSDQAGRWNRTATILGPSGRLRIFDDGFEWLGADGEKVDESRRRRRGEAPATAFAVAAIAEQLAAIVAGDAGATPRGDALAALAIAQAGLLSTRTGQAESPATIRRMANVA